MTPSFQTVNADIRACCDLEIDGGPGRTSGYDAGALLALATVAADISGMDGTGADLAGIVRAITGPEGEVFHAGVEGFKQALMKYSAGKDLAYVGVTGPIVFDQHGDVSASFSALQYRGGEFVEQKAISLEEVNEIKAMIAAQ